MKKIYLLLSLIFIFNMGYSQDTTKVLFIGNSLTYFNDMPTMVESMLKESNITAKVYQKTLPGINLKQHLELINGFQYGGGFQLNLGTFNKEKFDYIVLQEATIRLLIPHLHEEFLDIIHSFHKIASENGSQLLFYQPYPAYEYPKTYCLPNDSDFSCSDNIVDSQQELSAYSRICTEIKDEDSVKIVPIGKSFEEIMKKNSTYKLLSDGEHPSKLGSYIIAYNVYRSILKENYLNEFKFIEGTEKSTISEVFSVVDKIIQKNWY